MEGRTPFDLSLVDPAFFDPAVIGHAASPYPAAPTAPAAPAALAMPAAPALPASQQAAVPPASLQSVFASPPVPDQTLAAPPAAQQDAFSPPALQQAPAVPPADHWQQFFGPPPTEEQPVTPSPGGSEWNAWQSHRLFFGVCAGKTYAAIGEEIGRTDHACESQMFRLRKLERKGEWEELASYFNDERRVEFCRQRRQQRRGNGNPQSSRRRNRN
ncbi:hypothetical protein B0H67DRAFT_679861 [Lasiosphaeris hirsuta]|uniref:Myb-like domain-containing protein n=1 Tax=Lasiosphaeris hirsuta TaxID=260670 RepID=A0AA40E6E3_9PEZI|nr:hypothetical protein B0H67DRAFT_679861 [Lasiosphaeris hirsuta]